MAGGPHDAGERAGRPDEQLPARRGPAQAARPRGGARPGRRPLVRDGIGRLACDEHAFALLGLRATLKRLSGTDPGATANVRKLVAMEHGQQVTEFGFTLLGEEGALTGGRRDPLRARWTRYLLASRAMTIGGGTTEVNLNVIGERILGLPRDPEPVG
ncbi:acyl-CoA dehydrogenase family protein [Actinomadura luteofluorescens]|uniref:acyl-CoA dehydrogenase family protein n=1 Tax=Actinomadura luteofluorescens TaxID=46163 RepID=UPI00362B502C